MVTTFKKKSFLIYPPALLVIATALILVDSRAGWLSAVMGSMFIVYQVILKDYRYKKFMVAAMILIISISSVYLYNYKKASADGRIFIWKNTISGISEQPFTGHGIGSFERQYLYYQAEYFKNNPDSKFVMTAGNPSSPFNEFLRIFFEQGVVVLLLVIFILVTSFSNRNTLVNGSLLTFTVFSFFSYPLEIFRLYIFIPFLLANNPGNKIYEIRNRPAKLFKTAIAIIVISWSFYFIKEYERWILIVRNVHQKYILTVEQYNLLKTDRELFLIYYNTVKSTNRTQLVKDGVELYPSTSFFCDYAELFKNNREYSQAEQ
ncbi:MAG: O-antigen ligase family protein [Rikenellaceae bacterium]|nr:O-antigen ligase family protein [Rikenellaceae bacterium]